MPTAPEGGAGSGKDQPKTSPSPWALLESDDEYKDKDKYKNKDKDKYTVKENHQTVSAGWIGLKFKLIFISLWLYSFYDDLYCDQR